MDHRSGLTLIELMIVVVIIAILAAFAIPNYMNMQDRAREAAVKLNGHTCQLAVESYATVSDGHYPPAGTAMADITANLPGGVVFSNPFTGGGGLSIGTGAADGMVDYTDPAAVGQPNQYRIDCFGKGGVNIQVLANG